MKYILLTALLFITPLLSSAQNVLVVKKDSTLVSSEIQGRMNQILILKSGDIPMKDISSVHFTESAKVDKNILDVLVGAGVTVVFGDTNVKIKSSTKVEMNCNSGQAQIQKVMEYPGKTTSELYKIVNLWITKSFYNKDDKVIQSSIENEMIRGDGYKLSILKMGSHTYTDLRFSFQIDIQNSKIRYTMNGMKSIAHNNKVYSIENYCCEMKNIRTDERSQNIKESIESFTTTLLTSLNEIVFGKSNPDW